MLYSKRIVEAMALMYELHARQVRKASDVPYITHPMAVAALVGQFGGGEDQFIAALLHDAPEDQGGRPTLDLIQNRFGDRVAEYVLGCSDTLQDPKPPWKERKEAFIKRTANAPEDLRLIIACDKLHNLQCIIRDIRQQGRSVWERFTGRRMGTLWYYENMLDVLSKNWDHDMVCELRELFEQLKHLDAQSSNDFV